MVLLGSPLASKLSDRRPLEIFLGEALKKCKNWHFLLLSLLLENFVKTIFTRIGPCEKSTDSAFRICVTHGGQNDYWTSYYCSKSGHGGKSEFVPEIMRCYKKKTRPQFSKFWLHIESAWNYMGFFHADSIWSINFENCGRVFFFQHLISV